MTFQPISRVSRNLGPFRRITPRSATPRSRDLGTKEIEGITAHGYRTTRREVNASGDVRGRTGIDKVWVSDDFAAKLLGIRNSLEGKVTSRTSLIEISLAEPDATLFEIPSDYKVNSRGEPLRVQTGKKQ